MYDIYFSTTAKKQLFKLDKETQRRIIAALERIRIVPERYITKLVGDPAYKLRVGDYRVLMDVDTGRLTILVIKVTHRRSVYQ